MSAAGEVAISKISGVCSQMEADAVGVAERSSRRPPGLSSLAAGAHELYRQRVSVC